MEASEFRDLVAGYSEQRLADFLHVNLKTFRNWKSGKTSPPHSAILALQWHLWGELSAIGGPE